MWRISSYAISGRRKKCSQTFIFLVSAIWDQRQMSFVLLYRFHELFWTVGSCLCLSSTQHFSPLPVTSNNMWQTRQCRCLNHNQSQKVFCLLCAELRQSAFSSFTTWRILIHWDITKVVLQSGLRWAFRKTKTFLLRVTVTLTMSQMMLLAQTSYSGLTIQTVDLLYL